MKNKLLERLAYLMSQAYIKGTNFPVLAFEKERIKLEESPYVAKLLQQILTPEYYTRLLQSGDVNVKRITYGDCILIDTFFIFVPYSDISKLRIWRIYDAKGI